MQTSKLCALAGTLLVLTLYGRADTLTFVPQPGTGGTLDYSWFTAGNWFSTDGGGNLIPANRLPLDTDTVIITVLTDAGASGLRVQTLIATNNAIVSDGTFAVEDLVMLSGSSFSNSTVNVLVNLTVGGTNCAVNGSSLNVIGTGSGIFQPIAPAPAATLNLLQAASFQIGGLLTLTDGSRISSTTPPQSQLVVGTGGALVSTNLTQVLGSATNHLIIDNSGLIRVDEGTLTFSNGIDWQSSAGSGEFRAANSNAFLLFASPFQINTNVTDTFSGVGTNRWIAGAGVYGAALVSGNLEILDSVSGAGSIEALGTGSPGGVLTWSNGPLSLASVTVDSGATMNFTGGAGSHRQLSGCALTNSGLCVVLSGDLGLTQGASIFNLSGGMFVIQADGMFSGSPAPLGGAFNNSGTFVKKSSGTTAFGTAAPPEGPDFNNSGLVDIQGGQLDLVGGISSGEFRTEPGGALWFWGGTHTLNTGASFTGTGTVHLAEGIAAPVWLVTGPLSVSNLEVGTSGTLDASGNTNIISFGTLLADASGSLNNGRFVAANLQMQDSAVLTNSTMSVSNTLTVAGTNCALLASSLSLLPTGSGTMLPLPQQTNCSLILDAGSIFLNSGKLQLNDGAIINGGSSAPQSELLVPQGALIVSSNRTLVQGSATNHLMIDNSGTIRANNGVLQFGTGLDWKSSGGFGEFRAVLPTSLLAFVSAFHNDSGATTLFSGAGTNQWLNGGSIAGEGQVSGNLQVLGSVSGMGSIHVLGSSTPGGVLNWANGTLSLANINIDLNGTILINPGAGSACQLAGCLVNNSGSCFWAGPGAVQAGAGASLNNLPGGTLDLQTDVTLLSNAPLACTLNNGGLLLKSGGTASSIVAVDFNNYGVVEIKSGNLTFGGGWAQTLGSTTVDTGAVLGGTTLNVEGGSLEGLGTIDANVINSGTVNPGNLPGILTIGMGSDYQQTSSGTLALEIAGTTAGSQYDQLAVSGAATLAGRLTLILTNGFTPTPGDRFQVLTSLSQRGSFSSVDPSPISGTIWVPQYYGTNVTVLLADAVALAQPTLSNGVLTLPFKTTVGLSYVVQATGDLAPPNWQTIETVPGNGSVMTVSDSVTNMQRFYRVFVQ